MKKDFFWGFLFLFLFSCSNNYIENESFLSEEIQQEKNIESDDIFSFDSITAPHVWKTFRNYEEMRQACQIPTEKLKSITTENLIKICMEYPLALNYLAYNDFDKGIETVIDSFNGFQELLKRNDASDKLINYYKNLSISDIAQYTITKNNSGKYNTGVTPLKVDFFERLLVSKPFESLLKRNSTEVYNIIAEKQLDKLVYPTIFNIKTLSRASIIGYNNIETKCGKIIQTMQISELTPTEIQEISQYYTVTYPNATMLGNASSTYNCHSFAWNMTDGGAACWINSTIDSANDNISKYWSNDYYMETEPRYAKKIFYPQADHSAIVSEVPGMYESKWGSAPLMRHAPEYGPYPNMDTRIYFTRNFINHTLSCSEGERVLTVGETASYTVPSSIAVPIGNNVQISYELYNPKGEELSNSEAIVAYNGNSITATFKKVGIYEFYIYYSLKNTGEKLAEFWFEPIVTNEL